MTACTTSLTRLIALMRRKLNTTSQGSPSLIASISSIEVLRSLSLYFRKLIKQWWATVGRYSARRAFC